MKGSLVLGQVCEINDLEISLALPNNLVGHVSITAISTALTKRIEAAAAAAEVNNSEDEFSDDDVDLKELFEVGQYLRAYVVSTTEDSTVPSKAKRRIELSVRPEDANSTLSKQELVPNATLMASVASVEDHGYVMDVGLAELKITGFLPKKEVDTDISEARLQPGSVFLCVSTGLSANRKVSQLSIKSEKLGNIKNFPAEASTINTFLPGTAVEVLVNEISDHGLIGKVLGDLDVTADLIHSGIGPNSTDLAAKYKVPSKIKARVICTFPEAKTPKLGISILDHVKSLQTIDAEVDEEAKRPLDALPISSVVEECKVKRVETDIGLFVDVGIEGVPGFVHISRVKDGKVDGLYETSGPFKVGSKHKGRVVGYNAFDGLYLLSFEKNVLEQPFLRIEDVPVGNVVDGVVEKLLVGENGVSGLIVKLAEGISGLVPDTHLSDVRLQHPEKKFREGSKVRARVLSTDLSKRQLRLTLKKTLVNSEEPAIKSYDEISIGMQVLGTIINVMQNGAIVQFYGNLRGFLPLSEMSEAYISDAKEHFRKGQVVNVHVIDLDAETKRLVVSCKDPTAFGMDKQLALKNLSVGNLVSGKVSQKTEDDVFVELEGSLLKAVITLGHLTDKSSAKNQAALKRIRVGQTLSELAVLEKNEGRRSLVVTMKPSMVAAAKEGNLLFTWEKAKVGQLVHGFVRNITPTAVFVQFGGKLTALLPAAMMPQEQQKERDFGLQKLQSIGVKIVSIDQDHSRAVVAIPSVANAKEERQKPINTPSKPAENPVDDSIKSEDDISVGKITKAKIVSIKSTQLNVRLADNIQGRVDVSQAFDSWEDIRHPKNPLQKFKQNSTIKVKVLGVHDARNHRFLPISHRSTHPLIELSAKPSDLKEEGEVSMLSLDKVEAGSEWIGFVNNLKSTTLWVNLSPSVRGRLAVSDASNDLALLSNPSTSFPIGSALKVQVKAVNAAKSHLDLTAKSSKSSGSMTWDTIKKGLVLPGKVTKVTERQVMVQLSEDLSGPVHLSDLEDDYDEANPKKFAKNEIIRVAVVDVDNSNKKLRLSTRPSRVLNSNLPVKDVEISTISALKTGDIVRGFVKNVSDKGLFVNLGGHVTALVKISDLSDSFLKDWKVQFQVDQLVKGRITAIDVAAGQVNLSLKASTIDNDYKPPKILSDFIEGEVVTGRVRKVEDFGVFIVIDNTSNVSGLCHRSEMAEKLVKDARKFYSAGDAVKARIMKIDLDKKTINFGLKPSYFEDEESDEDMEDSDDAGAALDTDEDDSDDDREFMDAAEVIVRGTDNDGGSSDEEDEDEEMADGPGFLDGPDAGGFDWSGGALDEADVASGMESDADITQDNKKARRKKAKIQVDRTAQMDANGPQTATDFERLLMGQPDASELWMQYMAFHLQVSEPAKAREIAERALKTINVREEAEKLNIWTAYLNLENAYGTDETLLEVFKRACQYSDEQVVHERLTTIYIKTGKHDVRTETSSAGLFEWILINSQKADDLFQNMTKKFGAKSPAVWINYAHFLHNTVQEPDRARALLSRATQALPTHAHVPVMTKFAALEFRSASGDPEHGRTLFEKLLSAYPKKFDLWNQLLDLEVSAHAKVEGKKDGATVRDVFERGLKTKGLKAHRAKSWFQRWSKWEEQNGTPKEKERVVAKAREWTREAEARKKAGEEE